MPTGLPKTSETFYLYSVLAEISASPSLKP